MRIEGSAPVFRTEDPDKVLRSIRNIFPNLNTLEIHRDRIEFSTDDPSVFVETLEQHRIRDTARMVLGKNEKGGRSVIFLNKQAAFMSKVNFTEGDSTLGDIELDIREGTSELMDIMDPERD